MIFNSLGLHTFIILAVAMGGCHFDRDGRYTDELISSHCWDDKNNPYPVLNVAVGVVTQDGYYSVLGS